VIEIGEAPASLENQSRHLRHLVEVNLVNRVSGPVIIHVRSIKIKNHGNTVLGVVPVVRTVINALRIGRVVVIVVEP